jgi:hypothetical protein
MRCAAPGTATASRSNAVSTPATLNAPPVSSQRGDRPDDSKRPAVSGHAIGDLGHLAMANTWREAMDERRCKWCGGDISHMSPLALSCSRLCKSKRDNKLNPYRRKPPSECKCKICGTSFQHVNPRARLCSDYCKKQERRDGSKRAALARKMDRAFAPLGKTCENCGVTFYVGRSRGQVHRGTCSDECAQQCRNSRWREMALRQSADWWRARKAQHRELERQRHAERALSMLLLPTQTPPEAK